MGNTVFPLLEVNPELTVYACDFSPVAVEIVNKHPLSAGGACRARRAAGKRPWGRPATLQRAKPAVGQTAAPTQGCACRRCWHGCLAGRVHGFVADLTQTDLCQHVPRGSIDFVTIIFVLQSVPPHLMPAAVANVARTLRPGGRVLFRDVMEGDLVHERRQVGGWVRRARRSIELGSFCTWEWGEMGGTALSTRPAPWAA